MLLASNTSLYQNESEEDSVSSSSVNRSGHPDALAYSLTYALLTGNGSQTASAATTTITTLPSSASTSIAPGLSVRRLSTAPPALIPISAFQLSRKSFQFFDSRHTKQNTKVKEE